MLWSPTMAGISFHENNSAFVNEVTALQVARRYRLSPSGQARSFRLHKEVPGPDAGAEGCPAQRQAFVNSSWVRPAKSLSQACSRTNQEGPHERLRYSWIGCALSLELAARPRALGVVRLNLTGTWWRLQSSPVLHVGSACCIVYRCEIVHLVAAMLSIAFPRR